jgi:hypothetical protein
MVGAFLRRVPGRAAECLGQVRGEPLVVLGVLSGVRERVVHVEVLEKISKRTRGASPAATGEPAELAAGGPAYAPVAGP